jgi:hypothetical protein
MRMQMGWYAQRLIASKMQLCLGDGNSSEDPTMYFALKMMMISVMQGSSDGGESGGSRGNGSTSLSTPAAGESKH